MVNEQVEFLKQLIAFQSISSDPEKAKEALKTAKFLKSKFEGLGTEVALIENEVSGKNPLIIGKLGNDPSKKRILFYSHYDVQPAHKDDGWDTEPFELVEKDDGYVYGRGTNDDKGPITSTYFAIKSLVEEDELPVNVVFLYEGEEESSSHGFEETVKKHRDFFGEIDGILILDTSWFNEHRPSLDYGFRGITYMEIEIQGPKKDQHSGLVGGSIHEPMTDLVHLMSKLISPDGRVLIPGFYDEVSQLTDEEEKLYNNIEFSLEEYENYLGADITLKDDPKQTLMDMWRNPALSIHGIEGAFSGPGGKTVVPAKVIGKVSMRLVPDQDPVQIADLFSDYIKNQFQKLNSSNQISVRALGTGDWWLGDVDNFLFKAASDAIEDYWEMQPAYARSGGSIPIIPFMERLFDAPAMGLGVGQSSDGAHSQNERIRIKNLLGAQKVIADTLKNIGSRSKNS